MFAGNVSINYVTKHLLTLDHYYLDRESQVVTTLLKTLTALSFFILCQTVSNGIYELNILKFIKGLKTYEKLNIAKYDSVLAADNVVVLERFYNFIIATKL